MANQNPGILARSMRTTFKIEPNELRSVLTSFLFVFTLMAAYYILRPVRESMAYEWSDEERTTLFWFTFIGSVAAVSLYGYLFTRVKFAIFVPVMYGVFAFSFLGYYIAMGIPEEGSNLSQDFFVFVDKSFFVWLSIFALFHLSIFWSFMASTFTKVQAPRLFGFIAAGSSAGAVVGPSISLFIGALGVDNLDLMLIAVLLLMCPIFFVRIIDNLKTSEMGNEDIEVDKSRVSTNPFSGFVTFLQNPFLLGIGIFILLYTALNTFIWFTLQNMMYDEAIMVPFRAELVSYFGEAFIEDGEREFRRQIWAAMDLVVNVVGIGTAALATGRIALRFGMAFTLGLVPVIIVAGFLVVALAPFLTVVIILQIVRRTGNYAITRPGREILFTAVDPEARFKAKSVLDVVVYRGGDAVSAEAYTMLSAGGMMISGIAVVSAGLAAIWGVVGVILGKAYKRATPEKVDTEAEVPEPA